MGPARLDLDSRRNLGELIRATLQTFSGHAGVFLSVTALIVVPVVVLVDGVWGRSLADGADADPSAGAMLASTVLSLVIVPSLVTALHVVIVQALAAGRELTVSEALDAAADRVRPAIGAVALYAVIVFAGFLALVIPGIWLMVRLYFGAQAAVVDGLAPTAALKRSSELVAGHWWQTLGRLAAVGLTLILVGLAVSSAIVAIEQATDSGVLYVALLAATQTLILAFSALFATLLFFDLRTQQAQPERGPRGDWPQEPVAPERDGVVRPEAADAEEDAEGETAPERVAWAPPTPPTPPT